MSARRYAVVGAGAVGGFYGGRLAIAGQPVAFVARSDVDALLEQGFRLDAPDGSTTLIPCAGSWDESTRAAVPGAPHPIVVAADAGQIGPVDVVLVATKTTDTASALHLVPPLLGPATVVVAVQNGLGVEGPLAEIAPHNTVLGAMAFLCSHKVGPAHVHHLDYGRITVGARTPDGTAAGITTEVADVVADLAAAGLDAAALDDLSTGRWKKLVWNIPYNGMSVVLDATTHELMAHPHTRALVEDLMVEVITAAAACGHPIERSFVDAMLADTEQMTPYAPSMKLDWDAGRPLELDAIYAAPLAAAETAGAPMTRVAALHAQLRFLNDRATEAAS